MNPSVVFPFIAVFFATCLSVKTVSGRPPENKYERYARLYYSNPANCAHCLPGWGVVSACNHTHPTVCKPCPQDTWSPHHPHLKGCQPCSKCGDGLYEEYKCTGERDTRCGWCHTRKGLLNDDFRRKCPAVDSYVDNQEPFAIDKLLEEERRNHENQGVPDDGKVEHEFWRFDSDDSTERRRINLHPSYHGYSTDTADMSHDARLAMYRRKAYTLFGVAFVLLVVAVLFFVWLAQQFCLTHTDRVINGRQTLYAHLTEQDNEIIRQCAHGLRVNSKRRSSSISGCEDDYWEDQMHVTENPMEHFIAFGSTDSLLPRKQLEDC